MPEGDSVYQLSKRLQWMQNREVTATSIRVPRYATVDFTGMTCERVWPRGKHLFMQFAKGGHQAQILHTHLKMEGTWSMHRAGTRWKKPGHAARVVLSLSDDPQPDIELVGFWLGLVRVFPARQYEQEMGYLGPDLLDPDFDLAEAVRRIEAQPNLEIGRALLDQRNLAGIGNEYRAEINRLDEEILAAVKRRTQISRAVGKARMGSGGTRLVHTREVAIINQFREDLGEEGPELAAILLRLGRGRLG